MVTPILLEVYYRSFYIASVFLFVQCFSYFTQGFQLEFFSGLFVTNFQAVDFNFYNDVKDNPFRKLKHATVAQQLLSSVIAPIEYNECDFFSACGGQRISSTIFDFYLMYKNKLSQNYFNLSVPNQPVDDFVVLSSNEAKTWSCLFIVYLNYFYCIELNKAVLDFLLLYAKMVYLIAFVVMHSYSNIKPGLLNKQKLWVFRKLVGFLLFFFILNQYTILTLIGIFEEFKLEQLDSELI